MSLKLIVVPLWLEQALKASNMSLRDATDLENLARIVSPADLDLYRVVNANLAMILPEAVVDAFETMPHPPVEKEALTMARVDKSENDALRRLFFYGDTSFAATHTANPDFVLHRLGYDYVILTVNTEKECVISNLMDSLLKELNAVMPLSSLAPLSIFRKWLESRVRFVNNASA